MKRGAERAPAARSAMRVAALALLAVLAACGGESQETALSGAAAAAGDGGRSAARLAAIAAEYHQRYLQLHPLFATELGDHRHDDQFGDYLSASWMADSLALEQETQAALAEVNPLRLAGEDRYTDAALRYRARILIEGFRYPSELLVVDPFDDVPQRFAGFAAAGGAQPFANVADYDRFLARMDGFVAWVDQAINNLRLGIAKDVMHPRVVIERSLPALAAIAAQAPVDSVFWTPIENFPASVPMQERARLAKAYAERLETRVLPAYLRLHDYLKNEYLPLARSSVSFAEVAGGLPWYAYLLRLHTASELTPQEAHRQARADVERLRARLAVLDAASMPEPPTSPPAATDVIDRRLALARARQRETAHGAMQLPGLRRDIPDPVMAQAWPEVAIASNESGDTREVLARQLRVAALAVVDTGLHAEGWTRARAGDWLRTNAGLDEGQALELVDRCIAQPARASSAHFGAQALQALRGNPVADAGKVAPIQAFDSAVLDGGWLPLPVLLARVRERIGAAGAVQ